MATGKLTKRAVEAATATGATDFLWDDDLRGFGLRITATGAKSYVYSYRMGGREAPKRRYTIGRHGSPWTPSTARAEAERLAIMVAQGIDPAEHDRERRRQAVDLAFSAYVGTFTQGYLKSRWKGWEAAERMLRREVVPILRAKPLPSIKKADVIAVFDALTDRPAVAQLVHATLRKLFRWALGRGEIDVSPLAGIERPAILAARDRVLNDGELALAWNGASKLGYPFGSMFRLLIATGQRREEVAALDWRELDRATATWTLAADRAKNGQAHIVPLNALALAEMDAIATLAAGSEMKEDDVVKWPRRGFVFTTTGKTAVSGYSRAKGRLDTEITAIIAKRAEKAGEEAQPMEAWRIHDLRRTLATGMQRLGIRFEVTEATLNHVSGARGGVAGVYQRHDWKEEKRAALDAWGRHIVGILAPAASTNVRLFPAGGKASA